MKRILSLTTFILCMISTSIFSSSSSWPSQSEQQKMLHTEIVKHLKLPASTTSTELCNLTYDQQVTFFCLILDLIMDSKCKITHKVMAEAFKKYCTEIKKRHSKLYEHFCKTTSGTTGVISYMQKYDNMSSSDIPKAAADKRTADRKTFYKKHKWPWNQLSKMKSVSKKFR